MTYPYHAGSHHPAAEPTGDALTSALAGDACNGCGELTRFCICGSAAECDRCGRHPSRCACGC